MQPRQSQIRMCKPRLHLGDCLPMLLKPMPQARPTLKASLFVPDELALGQMIALTEPQARHLALALRAQTGDAVALFNGHQGRWMAHIRQIAKRSITVEVERQLAPHKPAPDVWLCFAPVKNEKIDFLVKRAVELGVAR